ncbi:MAG: hypothetical protein AAFV53_26755 [Myxococcota bacterium]
MIRTSGALVLALCGSMLVGASDAEAKNLPISAVVASSTETPGDGINYEARNLKDSKSGTVWVEGKSGSGLGESVTVSLSGSQTVTGVRLWAGVWASQDFWERHNRPREIELSFSDGSSKLVSLEDKMVPQEIKLDQPTQTDSVTIKIKSVHSGSTFNDTGISEIQVFDDTPASAHAAANLGASTVYPGYGPEQVTDGLVDTLWCENNTDGDGNGEWIEVTFDGSKSVSKVMIGNGNGSSFSMFREYNYAKSGTLTFSDGSTESITIKPVPMVQTIEFSPRNTSSVKLTFGEVSRGKNMDYNDLCISEFYAQ